MTASSDDKALRSLPLEGKVALVTGAARGIGRSIAQRLSEAGAAVVLNDKAHEDLLRESSRAMGEISGTSTHVLADVAEPDGAELVRNEAVAKFGRIDILVNNAALVNVHQPWSDISLAQWDQIMKVNLRSCYLMARLCEEPLVASGSGRIVNVGSITSFLGNTDLVHYSTSKGGLVSFTRSLAREFGRHRITVNSLIPGAIQTESELEVFGDDLDHSGIIAQQSIKRRGTPRDVSGVVAFLASDEASFITGQAIVVDGGWLMH